MLEDRFTIETHDELQYLREAVEISKVEVPSVVLSEDRQVVVGNIRLHYLDWGQPGKAPILFLHGGGLNAHTWDLVCLVLRGDYHCIALDQRGHGDSEWSPEIDYSPEAHLKDIEGFIESMSLERPIIVGQSLGGINGLRYASNHADDVAALVVVDVGPNVTVEGGQKIVDFMSATATLPSLDDAIEQAIAFNPLRDRRLLRRSILYNFRRLPDGKWGRKNDMRVWATTSVEQVVERTRQLVDVLPRITCPTLVVRGALSSFSDDHAAKLAGDLRLGTWVRVEGAGHNVQGDNPRGLIDAMLPFIRKTSG